MKNFDIDPNYDGVKKVLQNLNNIEAPLNFEQKLFERISQGENEKELSFIDKLFLPSRLLPSIGLAVTLILIFFITNIFIPSTGENPLLVNPRVRPDIISTEQLAATKSIENNAKSITDDDVFNLTEEEQLNLKDKGNKTNSINDPNLGIRITSRSSVSGTNNNGSVLTSVSPNGFISKRGLDYKQIYLQKLQRAKIEQMRKRIEEMIRNSER